MRIIAGKHKNRVIPTIKGADYRPSTGKFREALFSILTSGIFAEEQTLKDASILDLFAGTGSLSFEALSRGAKSATLVDINQKNLDAAMKFAQVIGEEKNIEALCANVLFLGKAARACDIAFLDAPYKLGISNKAIEILLANNWVRRGSIIVAELPKKEDIELLDKLELIREKIYGNSKMLIIRVR